MTDKTPRYRQLTANLRTAITSGAYKIGSVLPTELEISRDFGVSRHTVREALRLLHESGLIERRRHVGTIVVRTAEHEEFTQTLPSVEVILRYGRDVKLEVDSYDMPLACPLAQDYALQADKWLRIDGTRGPKDRLIGVTTAIIRRDCAPSKSELLDSKGSLGELVESQGAGLVKRIDQEIAAIVTDDRAARTLGTTAGGPALRARRLYYRTADDLFLVTESIHPAERFNYTLSFRA